MEPTGPVTFTVVVNIDHEADAPNVTTEPQAHERVASDLSDEIYPWYDDLADGEYVVSHTINDGCEVNGPDPRSGEILARVLRRPMDALTIELADVVALLATSDGLVQRFAGEYVESILKMTAAEPGYQFNPGFVDIRGGCPCCDLEQLQSALTLRQLHESLGAVEGEDEGELEGIRRRVEALERDDLPEVSEFTLLFSGVNCSTSFGGFINEQLRIRFRDLAPDIEARVVEILRETVERGMSQFASLGEQLAAWD